MRHVFVALALVTTAAPLYAQRAEPLAFRAEPRLQQSPQASSIVPAHAIPARTLLGAMGGAVGLAGGALVGAALAGDCNCDDPGLTEGILGGAAGAVIGAGLAASVPVFGSRCSYPARFGTSVLGSIAGAFVVASLGSALVGGEGTLAGFAVGTSVGAALGAELCQR